MNNLKIDYISDLHVDFWVTQTNPQHKQFSSQIANLLQIILPEELSKVGDVLIIAGDLGHYNLQTKYLLKELKKVYKDIIVTWGNHDLYLLSNRSISNYKAKSENRLFELKEFCRELEIHYLDGQVITIDGVKFGGTGSWYDLPTPEKIQRWKNVMNDSRKIYNGYAIQPYGMYQNYPQPSTNWDTQKFWLNEKTKLEKIAKEGCDVFISHVGLVYPPDKELKPMYVGNEDNIFYYTDNLHLLKESSCKVHIHGHTHNNLNYEKDGIKILCNPLGYKSEYREGEIYTKIKQIII